MRPLFKTAITLCLPALPAAFFASSLGLASCAEDGCVVDPSDPRCSTIPMSDLVITTSRLAKSGGPIVATIRNHDASSRVEATLGPDGPRVSFNSPDGDGTWVASVSATDLMKIPPGELNVTLYADNKMVSKILHVYSPVSFPEPMRATQNLAPSGRVPGWVQVSQGHIFLTSDSATNKRLDEYAVSGTAFTQQPQREVFFGSIPLTTTIDVSESQALRLETNGPVTNLDFGSLDNAKFLSEMWKTVKALTYSKSGVVAVDRQSKTVAVSGEGADGPLKVYSVSLSPMQTTVTNAPANKLAVQLGWGRIDGDMQLDLVALHADGTFAVYLAKPTTGLTYDQNFSAGLQTAAALQGGMPAALAVGDVDRDGLDDVMIAQNMQVTHLASEGNGSFVKTNVVGGFATDAIAVGDCNGDSKADLVVASKTPTAMLYFYPNQSP